MGQRVCYRSLPDQQVKPVTFFMTKGLNSSYVINEADRLLVASANQLAPLAVDTAPGEEADGVCDAANGDADNAMAWTVRVVLLMMVMVSSVYGDRNEHDGNRSVTLPSEGRCYVIEHYEWY